MATEFMMHDVLLQQEMPLLMELHGRDCAPELLAADLSPPDSPCYTTSVSDGSLPDLDFHHESFEFAQALGRLERDDSLESSVMWSSSPSGSEAHLAPVWVPDAPPAGMTDDLTAAAVDFGMAAAFAMADDMPSASLAAAAAAAAAVLDEAVESPFGVDLLAAAPEAVAAVSPAPLPLDEAVAAAALYVPETPFTAAAEDEYDDGDDEFAPSGRSGRVPAAKRAAAAAARKPRVQARTIAEVAALPRDDPENKRHTHNILERKRRNDLKNSYQQLRMEIPSLEDNERAPTGQILLHAVEFIAALKVEEQRICDEIALARAENARLRARFGQL